MKMLTIPNTIIQSQIYESSNSLVYRAIRSENQQPLILKVLKENYPTPQELARYRTEYNITKSLTIPGVAKAYDLQSYQNTLVMFLEDFGGESLKYWMQQRPFTILNFLPIAIKTTEILGKIHAANIIHKDINPANIVFNPNTSEVKIIDFGIATQLTRENLILKNPNVLEGTLAYISPEQTGRMNRNLDYRTDFYSLGVAFYEILTGQLPFTTTDPLELVHCHIAKQPLSPSKIKGNIPVILDAIILKLMAKTAEERYQSVNGIKADLEECLKQLQSNKVISDFPLGRYDFSEKFQLPQKLYGRTTEIETLLRAFDRVSNPFNKGELGRSELMLIGGYSGIGKSALVQELYKPITAKRGYFIQGKFDQFQRNIPYSAVVNAFRNLSKQLLAESEIELNQWRDKILTAVGVNGQVIIDVIPEVELIIGPQPPVPELGPNESQNRFNFVFQNFIKVFAHQSHPLVLFLDDLQWADEASLKLMQLLISGATTSLFLIGAYRDNEVSPAHPLMLTIAEIAKTEAIIEQIFLAPLDLEMIAELISDTLKTTSEKVKPLAELVLVKTGGNPFFISEFLQSLYTEGLLKFKIPHDEEAIGGWYWNLTDIQNRGFTDNVVELMAGKIQKLSKETQDLLTIGAAIGNQFNLTLISAFQGISLRDVVNIFDAAVKENLVIPLDTRENIELALLETTHYQIPEYKFVHDRIQQAAYTLISEAEKLIIHQKIGQILLKNTPPEHQEEKIFDIVNQLNFGSELIMVQSQKYELAKLNLIAGKKAKASNAYQPALNYLQVGLGLLATDSWQQQYHLTLALFEEGAETAYLKNDLDLMEKLIQETLAKAQTILDKVKAYEIKILSYNAQNKFHEAINTALEILKLLHIILPKQPKQLDILWGLFKVKMTIGLRPIMSLVNLPMMTEPNAKAAILILSKIFSSAYMVAPLLLPLIVCQQISLSLQWGNHPESALAYSSYGMILCGVVGDIETGYNFGLLAIKLLDLLNAKEVQSKTEMVVDYCIKHWREPLMGTLTGLQEAYRIGLETGDVEYAAYSANSYCYNAFFNGLELNKLDSEIFKYTQSISQMGQANSVDLQQLLHQTVLNLLGDSESPSLLIGKVYNEELKLPKMESQKDHHSLNFLYFFKLMLCCLFGEYALGVEQGSKCELYLDGNTAGFVVPLFYFYDSLARLGLILDGAVSDFEKLIHKVKANQKKMRKWAKYAPMNHRHKYLLVEAELRRVFNQDQLAIDYYEKAISLAKENKYIHELALSYELAAKFYLSKGKELMARAYMQEARYSYQLWGATAKVKDLERRYTQLSTATPRVIKDLKNIINVTTTGTTSNLDLVTIMKANQVISGEIVLDKLLSSLMKILIENAGSQRGYLILSNQGRLLIEAEGSIDREQVTMWRSTPITNCQILSEAIVNYVARTQESVVLHDAMKEEKFSNDPYLQANQPKSILCVPLLNQGHLVSIVYLENNLTTGAFTSERVEVLQLLSGQAAISLENARLYQTLEAKVEERTYELSQTLETLKNTQKQLVESEKMASLGGLVAGVAHEINTPLGICVTASSAFTEKATSFMESYQSRQMKRSELEQFLNNSLEISRLLQNNLEKAVKLVVTFKQVAVEQTTETRREFNLKKCLENSLITLNSRLEETGHNITIKGDENLSLDSYPGLFSQIITHLTLNTLIHGYQPGDKGQIMIEFYQQQEQVILSYSDDGQGISPENLPKIFEPFFTTKRGQGSLGLGLHIVYNLVTQKLQGKIDCESELGRGTKLIISFPLSAPKDN